MKKLLILVLLLSGMVLPVDAAEILAPKVPASGESLMPEETTSFGESLLRLIQKGVGNLQPELREAVQTCVQILAAALLFSVLPTLWKYPGNTAAAASVAAIGALIFRSTDSLIRLAADTVFEICEYGKLLCPVMTTALAAQGGIASSSALYVGTTAFSVIMTTLISVFFLPMVYGFLLFATANSALGEAYLRKFADGIKGLLTWLLKTILLIFTGYMSITGVITGTTDAAALKAAKITISTTVPVVGGILSDASESVLVSIGLMKNVAGIYGILAALAVFLGPFLKVGVQYLMLKTTAALCSIFAGKQISALVSDFSSALGLLLAMLASACLLVLISTVCFLKGAG